MLNRDDASPTPAGPFPSHVLPPVLRDMAEAAKHAVGGGHDLSGIIALGVTALATAPGLQVGVKPSDSLRTPACLFILVSAISGSGKSRTAKFFMDVVYRRERELQETFKKKTKPDMLAEKDRLVAEMAIRNDEVRRRLKGMEAGAQAEPDELDARISALHARLEAIEDSFQWPNLVAEDFTSSALARLMAGSKGRCMIFSSDARTPIKNLQGRHQKDGPDDALLIKIWSAESVSLSRRGTGNGVDQVTVNRLTASLLHLVQPDLVNEVMGNKALLDSGYMCRTLVAFTDSKPAMPDELKDVPPELQRKYDTLMMDLMQTYYERDEPATAYFTVEALHLLIERDRATVQAYRDGNTEGWSIRSRDGEQIRRISIVLHAGLHGGKAHEMPVEAARVSEAMQIMDWFIRQRQPLIEKQQVEVDTQVRAVVATLAEANPRGFTVRDAQRRSIIPGQGTAAEVQALLEDLVKRGILVSTIEKTPGKADRPLYLSARN